MKEKEKIQYIQNGREKEVYIHPWNQLKVLLTLFQAPFYQPEHADCYYLKESIKWVRFQNVKFYRNVNFICPKDTVLILENCTFLGNLICVTGGRGSILNPNLPTNYMDMHISGENMQYFNVCLKKEEKIPIKFYSRGTEVNLFNFPSLQSGTIYSDTLKIENLSSNKTALLRLNCDQINIKNSNIFMKKPYSHGIVGSASINGRNIHLENSSIVAFKKIELTYNGVLTIDENSYLCSNEGVFLNGEKISQDKIENLPKKRVRTKE